MFVVTGDRKARLQFFRDMAHQKVDNQKLLEIFVDSGGFHRGYTRGSIDYNFYQEFRNVPKKYVVTTPAGYHRHTDKSNRWSSLFLGMTSRNIIYMDLSKGIRDNTFSDFVYTLATLITPKRSRQVFINSELSESGTKEALDSTLKFLPVNKANLVKFRYINCVDKGNSYVYNVFDEDFERPYEEEVGIE